MHYYNLFVHFYFVKTVHSYFIILTEGYYVSTVGLNESTIRKYIRGQESHDIVIDKLRTKEYTNQFGNKEK